MGLNEQDLAAQWVVEGRRGEGESRTSRHGGEGREKHSCVGLNMRQLTSPSLAILRFQVRYQLWHHRISLPNQLPLGPFPSTTAKTSRRSAQRSCGPFLSQENASGFQRSRALISGCSLHPLCPHGNGELTDGSCRQLCH